MLWSMIEMNILEHLISVDDVLWFEVFLGFNGLSVAQSKGIIVQWSSQRLPYCDVLTPPLKNSLCISTMPSSDLSDHLIGSCVDVSHDIGLPKRVAFSG